MSDKTPNADIIETKTIPITDTMPDPDDMPDRVTLCSVIKYRDATDGLSTVLFPISLWGTDDAEDADKIFSMAAAMMRPSVECAIPVDGNVCDGIIYDEVSHIRNGGTIAYRSSLSPELEEKWRS